MAVRPVPTLTPVQETKLIASGTTIIENPKQSYIARELPRDIKVHHLLRALQVLKINQQAGRFTKTDFDVFVGRGNATLTGMTAAKRKNPPGTRRRSLGSLTEEWAERFLPFPGRIYFTSADASDLLQATLEWLIKFRLKAKRGNLPKNHPYKFAQSIAIYVDGALTEIGSLNAALADAGPGTVLKIINVAPHSGQLELWFAAMYDATREIHTKYSPGLGVTYGFTNSDVIGLRYGAGSGGPSDPKHKPPPPVVYGLPTVTLFIPSSGKSNAVMRPLGVWLNGYTKHGKPRFRKRATQMRTLKQVK